MKDSMWVWPTLYNSMLLLATYSTATNQTLNFALDKQFFGVQFFNVQFFSLLVVSELFFLTGSIGRQCALFLASNVAPADCAYLPLLLTLCALAQDGRFLTLRAHFQQQTWYQTLASFNRSPNGSLDRSFKIAPTKKRNTCYICVLHCILPIVCRHTSLLWETIRF